jgi:uncharacterized protein (TIGR02597 family)
MSLVKYFNPLRLAGLLGATLAMAAPLTAQTASTAPLGGMVIPLTPGADNLLGIPFTSLPVFSGPVHAIVDNDASTPNTHAINFPASVAAADASAWDGLHYIRFTSGAANGKYFTITTSTADGIIIDDIGDDLSGVTPTDTYSVFRYWTLASLFPPGQQTALVESTGNRATQRGSTVILPDTVGEGINRAGNRVFYLVEIDSTSTYEWRTTASGNAVSDDIVLIPDTYIIIRQPSTAGERSIIVSGAVSTATHTINVHRSATQSNDNYLTMGRPVPMRLGDIGLHLGSNFLNSTGNRATQRGDTLMIWENPVGMNPAANRVFYRVDDEWRDTAGGTNLNDIFIYGNGPLLWRTKQATSEVHFWNNQPNY